MLITIKSAMTHTPIFLAGTNLGQRFGDGQTKGGDTRLIYDTDLQCLIIKYRNQYAMVPLATIENMQPADGKMLDSYFAPVAVAPAWTGPTGNGGTSGF